MANLYKRSCLLPLEILDEIQLALDRGEYRSISHVIREALYEWSQRRSHFGYSIYELHESAQEGIRSGHGSFVSMSEIKAFAHQRANKKRRKKR